MKRTILENLERRKREKIDPCDNCEGTGRIAENVCIDCLGQGVLLTRLEYVYLRKIAGFEPSELTDDSILDATTIE